MATARYSSSGVMRSSFPTRALLVLLGWCALLPSVVVSELDVWYGAWWKEFLGSEMGNAWFEPWNIVMQAKFDELSKLAESEENKDEPFLVLMSGDSTMKHQWGAVCGFLAEREGRRFDPMVKQDKNGCCIDTAEGGGRGLCFKFRNYRFLSATNYKKTHFDVFYFGSGLHTLHMTYGDTLLEPFRVQQWLAYEQLLEDEIASLRNFNGPDARIIFMTTHTVTDTQYGGDWATLVDAWRGNPGNATLRAACESQVGYAATGNPTDFTYWENHLDIDGYTKQGSGEFTVDTYCEQGLMDRHGSVQLNRRAKPVLARLGIPLVDAGQIVEGQTWATRHNDGRHYHPLVPVELLSLMDAITAPMPSPLVPPQENAPAKPARDARARDESSGAEPEKSSFDLHGGSR